MARLLLVRHGQSEWNASRRWQGWADPPLSAEGEAQAQAAAARLAGEDLDVVVASDLRRAVQTAEVVAGILGLGAVEQHRGLRERDVGDWSGLTREEIEERWPGVIEAWRAGTLDRPPNGEGDPSFVSRVVATLERVALDHRGGNVLVVTHGGVIRAAERHCGAHGEPVANLHGCWLDTVPLRAAGARVVLLEPDGSSPSTSL
jgi:probable phosphoglycerate mutase